jgi:nucleoside-diphosphate-sugar epimerase
LPADAANVVYLAGRKFGTTGDEPGTWAVNALLPALCAERYAGARWVAFSTGNVYPFWPAESEGPTEEDPVGPVGEYAQSALARERILEWCARRDRTPMVLLRLNYAIEPRYGVLHDLAAQVRSGRPVDLATPRVNVIWQRDANAVALRALAHATQPPLVLNLTGRPAVAVRALAHAFARRWQVTPAFAGVEGGAALLSNAARCEALFGPPPVPLDEMVERVADWLDGGGRSLHQPTHFEMREGRF